MDRSILPAPPTALLLAALLAALSGCAPVGPNYAKPEIPTPDYWNTALRQDMHSSTPDIEKYWRKFNDSRLNKLISTAGSQNRDLAIAAESIEEARAFVGVARGGLQPFVGASGSLTRNRVSEAGLPAGLRNNPTNRYEAGTAAGWEMDFVGGLRRSVESAQASLAATEEFYRDAVVIIYGEVGDSYIAYRTLQERIAVANSNIKIQQESLRVARDRNSAGLAPDIDVSQAQTNLKSTQAIVPVLQTQLAATKNSLGVLAGMYPGAVEPLLKGSSTIPVISRGASIGIPANLVRSRPDIRAAERQLAAQTAQVGVATAELYPKFTLSGSFALQSPDAGDFFDSRARTYGFGPAFSWRIFEGGRIRESIKIEESRTRQAYTNYEKVVLEAVAEVESALASIANERDRLGYLTDGTAAARKTVDLVKDNYINGLVDFQNVLDAERNLFLLQDDLATSRGQLARNHIALYRALGGGSKMPPSKILKDKK